MVSNASGWYWHCLARETGVIGHFYSPGGQRGPWPWLPYALDNGAFACWLRRQGKFDEARWQFVEKLWLRLLRWASEAELPPLWAVVPDVPGDWAGTLARWPKYSRIVIEAGIEPALAAQDGMTVEDVASLAPPPAVIAVGGTTYWKRESVPVWCRAFPRVHVLRCNSPRRIAEYASLGVESVDGTGWGRGRLEQIRALEEWARSQGRPLQGPLWPSCKVTEEREDLEELYPSLSAGSGEPCTTSSRTPAPSPR